jgi:hypothetical protein
VKVEKNTVDMTEAMADLVDYNKHSMEKLQMKWTIEPGDGTGCSIQDAYVRNEKGICSILNCGKAIAENAISYGLLQKLCHDCEVEHKKFIDESLRQDDERLLAHFPPSNLVSPDELANISLEDGRWVKRPQWVRDANGQWIENTAITAEYVDSVGWRPYGGEPPSSKENPMN